MIQRNKAKDVTERDIYQANKLLKEGFPKSQIAKRLGMPAAVVDKLAEEMGRGPKNKSVP